MIGTRKTDLEYFDLEDLTVDSLPVSFTSATITIETVRTQANGEWIADRPRWFGQIVSEFYRPGTRDLHVLFGRTRAGVTITGLFLVGWLSARGIDITGAGALTLS